MSLLLSIVLRSDVCVGLSTDPDLGELSKSASEINLCRRVIHLSAPGMPPLCGGGSFESSLNTRGEGGANTNRGPFFADNFQ